MLSDSNQDLGTKKYMPKPTFHRVIEKFQLRSQDKLVLVHIEKQVEQKILLKKTQDVKIILKSKSFWIRLSIQRNPHIPPTKIQISEIFANCTFMNLHSLQIRDLPLKNCQFLTFLNAPMLEGLFLINNELSNLKSLSKTIIKPQFIKYDQNYLKTSPSFERIRFQQKVQITMMVEPRFDVLHEDLSNLVKLEAQFLQAIGLKFENRIEQKKLFNVFRERFMLGNQGEEKKRVRIIS